MSAQDRRLSSTFAPLAGVSARRFPSKSECKREHCPPSGTPAALAPSTTGYLHTARGCLCSALPVQEPSASEAFADRPAHSPHRTSNRRQPSSRLGRPSVGDGRRTRRGNRPIDSGPVPHRNTWSQFVSFRDVVWRSAPQRGKMFHVEQEGSDTAHLMSIADQVFGDRIDLARRYHDSLATAGVERGLIGPREIPRLWERHILNCAAIGELIDEGETVVDIGSGAGLPGIPLAIARPDLRVTLVEPLLRRTVYLAEIIEELDLNVLVVRGRAEQPGVKKEAGGADVVTSRAVAPLEKLAKWSLPLVHDNGRMLALKGSSAGEEVERDRASLTRMGAGKLEVVECGVDLLPTPTIVVRAVRQPRRSSRH